MTKRTLLILPALTLLVACQGRHRGAVAQKAAEVLHTASSCPNFTEAYYESDVMKEKYIEVFNNRDTKVNELNFNGLELVPLNGKPTTMKNGSKITASCYSNAVRLVARDMNGGLIETVIKKADDGGLQVEQRTPKAPAVHYTNAGALKTPILKFKDINTSEEAKKTQTAIPQNAAPTAPVTSTPAAPATPTAEAVPVPGSGPTHPAPNSDPLSKEPLAPK